MTATFWNRPVTVFVLLALLAILGLAGVIGGVGLLMDPSGEAMGFDVSMLDSVPVDDFLIPGLILVTVFGLFPLLAAYGVWALPNWPLLQKLTPWGDYHWSWTWSRVVAVLLILWAGLELLMWGGTLNDSAAGAIPPVSMGLAFAILIISGYGSVKQYLWVGETPAEAGILTAEDTEQ